MGFVDSLKEVKEIEMELYPNVDRSKVDGTFYYDESNNFRKFRLNETGFNNDISDQSHFTLGGIYLPKGCKPDVEDLMIKLRPQKNQKELKFKFFSYRLWRQFHLSIRHWTFRKLLYISKKSKYRIGQC